MNNAFTACHIQTFSSKSFESLLIFVSYDSKKTIHENESIQISHQCDVIKTFYG